MPRANAPNRTLNNVSVGELRRLVHAGLDEDIMLSDALAAFQESDRASAAHELDLRAFDAYLARREARRAAALVEAASAASKANRRNGDGAQMAARQSARVDAFETFEQREPLLDFADWVDRGRPNEYSVGVIRRAVKAVTSELVN